MSGRTKGASVAAGLVRDVRRFDRHEVDLVGGGRVAVAVAVAVAIGLGAGNRGAAASLGAGALLVGITTVVGGPRPSVRLLGTVAVAMGVSTFVGSASGSVGWAHTVLVGVWCLAGGLLMALGSPTSSVGTQAIAAMIVFGRFPETVGGAAELAGYVVAGGGLAVAVIGVARGPLSRGDQRRATAAAVGELAALLRPRPGGRSGLAAAGALDEASAALDRVEAGGAEDLEALRSVVEVGRRSRLELLVLDGLEQRLARTGAAPGLREAVARATSGLADAMEAVAGSLGMRSGPDEVAAELLDSRLDEAARRIAEVPGPAAGGVLEASLVGHLASLAGQVRSMADQAVRACEPGRRSRRAFLVVGDLRRRGRLRPAVEAVAAQVHWSSPYARHAVRLTLVVTAAEVLAHRTGLQHGYWVALTASVVLRPDFAVTLSRGVARMVGTCLGVGIAGVFAVAVRPSDVAMVVSAGVWCALACATFTASYVAFSGFLTALVVVLVDLVTPDTLALAGDRLVDTLIGGALALAAYGLWPSWTRGDAWRSLAELAAAQRAYLAGVLSTISGVAAHDEVALGARSAAARRRRATAETTVARSLAEPAARRIDAAASGRVLDALRRVSLATHALRAERAAGRPAAPVPELRPLGDGLVAALDGLAGVLGRHGELAETAVRGRLDRPAPALLAGSASIPPLRQQHSSLVEALRDRGDVRLLLAETDELVDAVDTAAHVLGLGRGGSPGQA